MVIIVFLQVKSGNWTFNMFIKKKAPENTEALNHKYYFIIILMQLF